MNKIKLLDCTLRDGGHINQGKFGKNVIKSIIANLVKAKIDIIEAGFLWQEETDDETARFHTISKLKKYLPKDMGNTKISLMADNINLEHIEPYDGTVEIIRLSFRKSEMEWVKRTATELKNKGYKIYINPIHGSSFSDEEFLEVIKQVNMIKPEGFSIVDTFGALRQTDLARIYYLIEHNLDKNIVLGIHLHENMGLAYSLAQYALNIASCTRTIILDGSLFGMGKIPGNLCIEQIIDYLNNAYDSNYSIEPVYDAIDDFIMPIYEHISWGYSVPYAISAQCGVHRTYAEYLVSKDRLHTKDIKRILNSIDKKYAEIFNKEYIEKMYRTYMLAKYDDSKILNELKIEFRKYDKFIIIAPGSTIKKLKLEDRFLKKSCVITVNFIYERIMPNYYFFTNAKRLDYAKDVEASKMIITSNLVGDIEDLGYIVSRNELSYHDDLYCEDSTLMLLNLLKKCGVKEVYIAGFDGFNKNGVNFYEHGLDRPYRVNNYDLNIRTEILRSVNYSQVSRHNY